MEEEKKPRMGRAILKGVRRYFEALKGKDYKTPEEAVDDAKYLTRVNIVIIVFWIIFIIIQVSNFGIWLWKLQ